MVVSHWTRPESLAGSKLRLSPLREGYKGHDVARERNSDFGDGGGDDDDNDNNGEISIVRTYIHRTCPTKPSFTLVEALVHLNSSTTNLLHFPMIFPSTIAQRIVVNSKRICFFKFFMNRCNLVFQMHSKIKKYFIEKYLKNLFYIRKRIHNWWHKSEFFLS